MYPWRCLKKEPEKLTACQPAEMSKRGKSKNNSKNFLIMKKRQVCARSKMSDLFPAVHGICAV
jgi:hypothetical protein